MTNNKARVLVVDDEPVVRISYTRSLAGRLRRAHRVGR
jgi:hypothetical protein